MPEQGKLLAAAGMESLQNNCLRAYGGRLAKTVVFTALLLGIGSAAPRPLLAQSARLTAEQAALLHSVCPTGFEKLPAELAPGGARVSHRTEADRLVAARQSQQRALGLRPISGLILTSGMNDKLWLVDQDKWYVAEDRAQTVPEINSWPNETGPVLRPQISKPEVLPQLPTVPTEPSTEKVAPTQQRVPPTEELVLNVPDGGNTTEAKPVTPKVPYFQQRFAAPPIGQEESEEVDTKPLHVAMSPHGAPGVAAAEARQAANGKSAYEAHAELYAKNCYPSAQDCAECHQQIYDDWSVSSHAYAFVSPMFQVFEQRLTDLSQGTVGYFCYRCHSPVGTTMATSLGYTRATPIGELPEVAREGVTCIACHRVNERFAKTNGDRRIVPGDVTAPVYGGVGGSGVAEAIARKDELKIKISAADKGPGQLIHNEGRFFDQLGRSEACTSCHQVAVHPGIKLEVVWEQYRASPACKKGISCQDCHMGRVPGLPEGYNYGSIAEMAGKTVSTDRKQSSHLFHGPGYSIAHPGLFPQNKDAARWTMDQWLAFDWRAGWGTDDFEDRVAEREEQGLSIPYFPPAWQDIDDRYDARDIVDDNLKRLERKRQSRELVMENGSHVDGPFFKEPPTAGRPLRFEYVVANKNEGHNLPTASLGAQPQLWANIVLIGPDGQRLWETGYTDTNGDLCDIHSEDVRNGRAPFDSQLFNLQTMFLITGATGTDREFPLPVNFSIDQVPHLRPGTIPISVTNHPPFIRMESRSIPPLGKKRVKYKVPAELMCQPGRYRLSFRLRSRTEPMYFMRFCNATPQMLRAMTEGILDIHPYSVEFEVKPGVPKVVTVGGRW